MFACATILAIAQPAFALDLPGKPTGHVNDYAGALSSGDRAQLEAQLVAYGQGTTRQYAVAIFKSLDGQELDDFSIRLADAWSLKGDNGKKSGDGVLLTVFIADHKLRIEVGYALEGKLTDVYCADLISGTIAPAFHSGDIAGGIAAAFAAIDFQVTGEHRAVGGMRRPPQRGNQDNSGKLGGLVLFVILIVVIVLLSMRGRGGGGGGAANVLSFIAGMLLGGRGWSSGGGGSDDSGGGFGGFGGGGGGGFSGSGFGGGGASGVC